MTISRKHSGIGLISLGCAKNLVDSEVLMRQLESNRFRLVFEPTTLRGIDTIIINTCGFIGDARQESIDTILRYAFAKKSGQINHLFVMGCLTERYREDLSREIPEADGIFGVNQFREIVERIGGVYHSIIHGERAITTPAHYAYLKIAEGCDRTCSFCAIPMIRGAHRSRPLEEILQEASWLAGKGVRELIVISQDTTFYGIDLYGKRRVAELLRRLAGVKGLDWIRLHYTYPHGFPKEVLEVMRDHSAICNYIDMPLQHISDRILRSMKRGVSGTRTRKLLEKIRETVPGVTIRTTLITGYPGETDKEFDELCRFVTDFQFDRLGVFAYSHEEGTPAANLIDSIPEKIKKQRQAHLMKIQENLSQERNRQLIGKVIPVLVDTEEEDFFVGRTEADSPEVDQEVLIRKNTLPVLPGNFYPVLITGADHFDLMGEINP